MKVLKKEIKKYNIPIPVFDVTINKKTPCFALSAGVISHNTSRWQAAQHTVPKSTELMDLRASRYEDGIKIHYDYCLHKNTPIILGDGSNKTISELLTDFENGIENKVVSKNLETGKLEEKEVINVFETQFHKTLLELKFDKDLVIRCTPNHKFILKTGEVKEAKDLNEHDEIDDFKSTIDCKICGDNYGEITYGHVNKHNVVYKEYKEQYQTISEFSSYLRAKKLQGKKLHTEWKKALAKGALSRWESQNEKEKQSQRGVQRYNDPKERERQSLLTKKQWENPEVRQKMIQGICDARPWQKRVYSKRKSGYLLTKKGGKIWYRSSYEKQYAENLDKDPNVVKFKFEPFYINIRTEDNIVRKYLPDILVYYTDNRRELIEVKAEWEKIYFINSYKYIGATEYCNKLGIEFKIKTEKDIFI